MSGVSTGTALMIGGLAGAGGGIASGIMGANAASNAASTQANAAEQAAQLQYQASQNALGFQENQWNTEQQEMQPWLQSGQGALSNLDYLMGVTPGPGAASGAMPAFGPRSYGQPENLAPDQFSGPLNGSPAMLPMPPGAGIQAPGGSLNLGQPGIPSSTPASPAGFALPGGSARSGMPFQRNAPVSAMTAGAQSGAVPALGYGSQNFGPSPAPVSPGPPGMQAPGAGGFGSLMAANPYGTFTAPSAAQMEANDPGYQARLNLGEQALEHSAAARGGVLTGATAQSENQYAQDYASNEYNNYYNQAFNTNAQNYNAFAQNQANQYNRLAAMAGMGQTTAGQLGTLGTEMSGQIGSNLTNTAAAMGQQYNNAAAANASGMIGSANAYGGAIGGATGSLSNMLLMQQLLNNGAPATGNNPYYAQGVTFS